MRRNFPLARSVFLLLLAAFLFGQKAPVLSAAYQDELIFRNGQKFIGEIKGLDKGMLTFKTDEMGTIYVKWVKVVGLSSPARFRVILGTGQILVGSFERAAEEGKVVIVMDTGKVLLELELIMTIDPFEKKFLDRLKGEVNAGFSLQRAQSLTTYTLGAQFSYVTSRGSLNLGGSSYLGEQEAVGTTTRNSVALTLERDLRNRYVVLGTVGFQQNTELGLSRRLIVGGGLGNRLIYTNFAILTAGAGVVAVDEKYSDAEASNQNVEANIIGQFSAFRHTFPKLDFVVSPMLFPSLTDWGRVRFELDTTFSYEIWSNFYIGLEGFYSYDSRPPTETVSKRDYGISTSIRWKFNK